jgi:hypothetical protein
VTSGWGHFVDYAEAILLKCKLCNGVRCADMAKWPRSRGCRRCVFGLLPW